MALGDEGRCPLAQQNESQWVVKPEYTLVNIYFIADGCNLIDCYN